MCVLIELPKYLLNNTRLECNGYLRIHRNHLYALNISFTITSDCLFICNITYIHKWECNAHGNEMHTRKFTSLDRNFTTENKIFSVRWSARVVKGKTYLYKYITWRLFSLGVSSSSRLCNASCNNSYISLSTHPQSLVFSCKLLLIWPFFKISLNW